MAISLGSIEILPIAVQIDPGVARVRLYVCQTAWEAIELDSKRFTLRAGHLDFHALPFRIKLEPYWPVTIRLDFPIHSVSSPLLLRCTRSLFLRAQTLNLLEHDLDDHAERLQLDAACRAAWIERALKLERAFEPKRLRQSLLQMDAASTLLDRYLHHAPEDPEAQLSKRRLQLKKSLAQHMEMGDWLRARRLSEEILALQPDWPGFEPPAKPAIEQARDALMGGWIEVAEEKLHEALQSPASSAEASLLLARVKSAWRRNLEAAAKHYVDYFRYGGANEVVVAELLDLIDGLEKRTRVEIRGDLLSVLTERLVARPDDFDLANVVYEIAERQSVEGAENEDDLVLLWACYEKAFEHQVAVDRRVERMLIVRLEALHRKLGNIEDWVRIRRQLAAMEPENVRFREELGDILHSVGEDSEALYSDLALWIDSPLSEERSRRLLNAARKAGDESLALRAGVWLELLGGKTPTAACPFQGASVRLLFHPDLRPLFPLLQRWGGPVETGSDAKPILMRLADVQDGFAIQHWRELEAEAKQLSLIPSMEAALSLREPTELDPLHPLRVAARLSLDRLAIAQAASLIGGLAAIGAPVWHDGRLDLQAEDPLTRYRALEIGRFLLGPLWESEEHQALLPKDPLADFLESMLRHGLPDMTTRAYFDDVRKTRRIGRADWRRLEMQVLAYLKLGPVPQVDDTLL